jgi:hypothetical protein
MPTCRYCGKETTQADAAYCTYCGSSFQQGPSGPPPSAFGLPPSQVSYATGHDSDVSELHEKTLRRIEQLASILVLLSVAAVILVLL